MPKFEKRDDNLGTRASYTGGMTVRLIDKAGRVVRRAAVGEAATTAEVEEAMDYLLAMAWAAPHVRRRGPPRGEAAS